MDEARQQKVVGACSRKLCTLLFGKQDHIEELRWLAHVFTPDCATAKQPPLEEKTLLPLPSLAATSAPRPEPLHEFSAAMDPHSESTLIILRGLGAKRRMLLSTREESALATVMEFLT